MPLGTNPDAVIRLHKLEQGDYSGTHELGSYGSANEAGKFVCANGKILFNLDHVQLVAAAFCLNWENVVRTLFVEANIEFIRLYLPHVWNGGSEMVLQRITSHTCKDVNQSIVAKAIEQFPVVREDDGVLAPLGCLW